MSCNRLSRSDRHDGAVLGGNNIKGGGGLRIGIVQIHLERHNKIGSQGIGAFQRENIRV